MGASWRELRVGPFGALTWTVPGLAGEVGCVRGQALPPMEWQDWGGFSQKEKDPWGLFGEFCSNSSNLLSTQQPGAPVGLCGAGSKNLKPGGQLEGECTPPVVLRPWVPTGSQKALCVHTHRPEEGDRLNLWVRGPLESWTGGCPRAGLLVRMEKSLAGPHELAAAKNTSKTCLASLKPAGLFFFVFGFFFK